MCNMHACQLIKPNPLIVLLLLFFYPFIYRLLNYYT